jgi:hypothetical protein
MYENFTDFELSFTNWKLNTIEIGNSELLKVCKFEDENEKEDETYC